MKKLHFDYWMEILYTEPVKECHYTIKCLPQDTDMQRIVEQNIELIPQHDYQRSEDSFGNLMIYDNLYCEHQSFGFRISGTVLTGLSDCEKEKAGEYAGIYRYDFGLNRAGEGIKAYFIEQMSKIHPENDRKKARFLMECLHRDFSYEKGCTHGDTTAEEAWRQKKGVCQDYAHIFLALCHLAKIPARYVTGMMRGEGFSHAWVEIFDGGYWYGMDPTNGCESNDSYIKIGIGRDANDCLINKGTVIGGGSQCQNVRVCVELIEGEEE